MGRSWARPSDRSRLFAAFRPRRLSMTANRIGHLASEQAGVKCDSGRKAGRPFRSKAHSTQTVPGSSPQPVRLGSTAAGGGEPAGTSRGRSPVRRGDRYFRRPRDDVGREAATHICVDRLVTKAWKTLPGPSAALLARDGAAGGSTRSGPEPVSGPCPFQKSARFIERGQCVACIACARNKLRSAAIQTASHAEGRWFDPSRDHHV